MTQKQLNHCDELKEKLQNTDEIIRGSGVDQQLEDCRKGRESFAASQERANRLLGSFKRQRGIQSSIEELPISPSPFS